MPPPALFTSAYRPFFPLPFNSSETSLAAFENVFQVREVQRADRDEVGRAEAAQILGIGFFPDGRKHDKAVLCERYGCLPSYPR